MAAIDFKRLLRESKRKQENTTPTLPNKLVDAGTENGVGGAAVQRRDIPMFDIADKFAGYMVGSIPNVFIIPDFLTEAEEERLRADIYNVPDVRWTQLKRRRLQNWGGSPSANGMIEEDLPGWLRQLGTKLVDLGVFPEDPNHVLINEYAPGQGIMPHKDGPLYFNRVAIVSTCGHSVMEFRRELKDEPTARVFVPRRSLLIFEKDAYTTYFHGIAEKLEDQIDATLVNAPPVGSSGSCELERTLRVSLTIRIVPYVKST